MRLLINNIPGLQIDDEKVVAAAGWQLHFQGRCVKVLQGEEPQMEYVFDIWYATHAATGRVIKFNALTDENENNTEPSSWDAAYQLLAFLAEDCDDHEDDQAWKRVRS